MKRITPTISNQIQKSNFSNKLRPLCLMMIALFLSTSLISQQRVFTNTSIAELADRSATEMWGEVYPSDPIPYYGPNDEIIAYAGKSEKRGRE